MTKIEALAQSHGEKVAIKFYNFAHEAGSDYEVLSKVFSNDACIENVIKLLSANYNPGMKQFGVNEITLVKALKNYPIYNDGDKDIVAWILEQRKRLDRGEPWYNVANTISSYTGGPSSALGKHLERLRIKPSPDCEAHHIIPYDMWAETKIISLSMHVPVKKTGKQ